MKYIKLLKYIDTEGVYCYNFPNEGLDENGTPQWNLSLKFLGDHDGKKINCKLPNDEIKKLILRCPYETYSMNHNGTLYTGCLRRVLYFEDTDTQYTIEQIEVNEDDIKQILNNIG